MSLARLVYELDIVFHVEYPVVRNVLVWAGSILLATSSGGDPAWSLGQRLLHLCQVEHTIKWTVDIKMCREDSLWPETLKWPVGTGIPT